MQLYLASPNNQLQCEMCKNRDVLINFANVIPSIEKYMPSFDRILIDSGAYSTMTGSRPPVDVKKYVDWVQEYEPMIDAWAGLDDIQGDWRQSLKNYEYGGFPTIHDTDPIELLEDLIPLARERGRWIGLGLIPPRHGKEDIVRSILDKIPEDLHVHGFALLRYRHLSGIHSFDSTTWISDSLSLRKQFPWLTMGEAHTLSISRALRQTRVHRKYRDTDTEQIEFIFD